VDKQADESAIADASGPPGEFSMNAMLANGVRFGKAGSVNEVGRNGDLPP
jgi:hypothetical protein